MLTNRNGPPVSPTLGSTVAGCVRTRNTQTTYGGDLITIRRIVLEDALLPYTNRSSGCVYTSLLVILQHLFHTLSTSLHALQSIEHSL